MTRYLLIANFIIFFLSNILERSFDIDVNAIGGLHYYSAHSFHWWQPFTYMFLHADFSHILEKLEIVIDPKIYNSTSIGSDEVGTGDYFGPIVVCAAYVTREDISFLESLGVKDSKKMTDEKILEVVPKFIKKIPYECIILSNKEYNEKYANGFNMNKLKAILHNKALFNLRNKVSIYDYIVVDQFAEKYVYFSYLRESTALVRDITFMTKAEDKCLSVACASLISRFVFLKEFAKISESVGELLPKGASTMVDEKAVKIVKK